MAELSEKILQHLAKVDEVNTLDLATLFCDDHQKIIGALKSIQATGDLVTAEPKSEKYLELTEEGRLLSEKGIPFVIYSFVKATLY